MKKRVCALLLLFAMVLPMAVPASAAGTMAFTDVKSNDWFYPYVKDLYSAGVINGTTNTTFTPYGNVKFGEALKLILLAAGYKAQSPTTSHWASGYYRLAAEKKLLPDGLNLTLDQPINRLQIAEIAMRALGLKRTGTAKPFKDTTANAALTLYDHGIFKGSPEENGLYFYPNSNITRAEVSAVVYRMYQLKKTPSAPPTDSTKYITFQGKKVAIVEDIPKADYDNNLFQVNENGFMTYDSDKYTSRIGIDVSRYQGEIDWAAVKKAGVEFAFLRLGYRGYGSGKIVLDTYFYQNLKGALANGIDVGVYFFSQAITPEEGAEEAQFCIDALKGYSITYPMVFDWEPYSSSLEPRTQDLDDDILTKAAVSFCKTAQAAGYEAMVYGNLTYFYLHFDMNQLKDFPLWLAQYNSRPSFYYHFDIWQYGEKEGIPGINTGSVDLNIQFIPKH